MSTKILIFLGELTREATSGCLRPRSGASAERFPRTVHNYIGLKAIRTVRVGRRVLVPMKSVNEVATRGIPPVRP